mgnify:FL=1
MAKLDVLSSDVLQQISDLKIYRSGWANDIREGWQFGAEDIQGILFGLYEISGSIILALEQVVKGHYRDKMAMILVQRKLQNLVKSEDFKDYDELCTKGFMSVISSGTKHHIRVMFDCLKILTA